MKGLFRHLSSICIIFTVILSFPLFLQHADVSEYIIYTRITEIVLPPELIYREAYPNWTFFEFEYNLEVINPSGKILYIISSTTCLVYVTGNLSFENEQFSGFVWGPNYCGDMFTNHTINPGINIGTLTFELSVNDTLAVLPNGNYKVWIFLAEYVEQHNYHNFTSEIAVNGSDIQIIHNGANATFMFPEEPTPTTDLSYSFLVTLSVGILVLFLLNNMNEIRGKLNRKDR